MVLGDFFYNENQPFITKDIFFYDVKECYPRILKKIGISIPDFENKLERNIYIGSEVFKDRKLLDFCQTFTRKIIKNFININNISFSDIIMVERDGLAIKKFVEPSDIELQPEFREKYNVIIRSFNNKQAFMMIVDDRKIYIKGVRNKTIGLEDFATKYFKTILNFKLSLISKTMSRMRKDYFSSTNWKLFGIPQDDESYMFKLKTGNIKLKQLDKVDVSSLNIDKYFYFKNHLEGFVQSLLSETI